jgi:hypothetical protein
VTLLRFTLVRYGIVTILSYVALLSATAMLVEIFNVDETFAYVFSLAAVYAGVYLGSATYVFGANNHQRQWYKFLIVILVFWCLNSVLFKALITQFDLHYLFAACVNILIFGPLRYFVNKMWVFTDR